MCEQRAIALSSSEHLRRGACRRRHLQMSAIAVILVLAGSLTPVMASQEGIAPPAPVTAPGSAAPAARLESTISAAPVSATTTPAPEIRIDDHTIDVAELKAGVTREGPLAMLLAQTPRPQGVKPHQKIPYLVLLNTTLMQQAAEEIAKRGGDFVAADAIGASFLVRMEAEVAANVKKLPAVDLVIPERAEYKFSDTLAAELDKNLSPAVPASVGPAAGVTKTNKTSLQVSVLLFPDVAPEPIISKINAFGGKDLSRVPVGHAYKIRVRLPIGSFGKLAALPEVWRIDLDLRPTLFNDHAFHILRALEASPAHRLTGKGQVIGHADTGLDTGIDGSLHADLQGRVLKVFPRGRPASGASKSGIWSDPEGHGTHTAASLVGSGAGSSGLYHGVAPEAMLVHQSLDDGSGGLALPSNYGILYQEAYDAGARIHSDSWGIDGLDSGAAYGQHSRELDAWSWNEGRPHDMLIVCAAGNSGPAGHSISEPATAKNCLTVGASKNDRLGVGTYSGNADEVAAFSARGPTADGRIKPDVVAPGTWIVSARTRAEHVVWQSSAENPDGWTVPESFTRSAQRARSAGHSWHYARVAGGAFSDSLVSPAFAVPAGEGEPLVLEVALQGTLGRANVIRPRLSVNGGNWESLEQFDEPLTDHWSTQEFTIPESYKGRDGVKLAIEVAAGQSSTDGIDLFFDNFRITTFRSWGFLADENLASPGDPTDSLYTFDSGTSMAAPMVAGAAALVREYFQERLAIEPSAELLKAALINGAVHLGTDAWPSFAQGWGRVDLERSIVADGQGELLFQDNVRLSEGQVSTMWFTAEQLAELRLTLVWCDPPGARLVNNLTMILYGPDGEPRFPVGASASAPDNHNNVEVIALPAAQPGLWRLEVTGKTIAQGPQPFALVISGAVKAAKAPSASS